MFHDPLQKVDLIVPGTAVLASIPFRGKRPGTCIGFHSERLKKPYEVLLTDGKTLFLELAAIELDYERERAKLAPIAFCPCPTPGCQVWEVLATLLVDLETETRPDWSDEGYRQYRCQNCRRIIQVNQDGQLI